VQHIFRSIPGWFSFAGVYEDAVSRAPRSGAVFVEVGAWKGKSASFMAVTIANSGKSIEFFVVDHWLGSDETAHKIDADVKSGKLFEVFTRNTKPVAKYMKPLRMSSAEASDRFADGTVDFILLDGGHDYDSVRVDLDRWLPKMKPGGIVAGDDWNWKGVKTAVTETFGDRVEVLGDGKGRHWRVRL